MDAEGRRSRRAISRPGQAGVREPPYRARGRRGTPADVVKLTTYVVNYKPELRPLLVEARSAVFSSEAIPASTLVGVQALAEPGYLIEVEASLSRTRLTGDSIRSPAEGA